VSEHLQRILNGLPQSMLEVEEQRVHDEIIRLTERKLMLGKAIAGKHTTVVPIRPEVEYVTEWTEEEWGDLAA
jgi:hypothetical protein